MHRYRRLTYEDRCQIEILEKTGHRRRDIARLLNRHHSTIYREIKRNVNSGSYLAVLAEKRAGARCFKRRPKLNAKFQLLVLEKLKEGWSPEQIAGRWKKESFLKVSHETIYKFVRQKGLYRPLMRFRGRRGAGRTLQRRRRPYWMRSITERPSIVSARSRIGDWERDTMVIGGLKHLLVLTERKSRFTKIAPLTRRTTHIAAGVTKRLLRQTGGTVHTITNDNGIELKDGALHDVPVYYCHPFAPHQRGTIENTIGLIRQYISRKEDLKNLPQGKIRVFEDKLNYRPRKCLDYKTPYEVFYKKNVALAV